MDKNQEQKITDAFVVMKTSLDTISGSLAKIAKEMENIRTILEQKKGSLTGDWSARLYVALQRAL